MNKGDAIKAMLREGKKYGEITRSLGVAGSTVAYHAKMIGLQKFTFERKVHDWILIQKLYDEGYTFAWISEECNIEESILRLAQRSGRLKTVAPCIERKLAVQKVRIQRYKDGKKSSYKENDDLFVENGDSSTGNIKKRIIAYNLMPYACVGDCVLNGIIDPEWAGHPITLHLDHENGIRNDHRLTNLRFLCPNCHSQTETYCGRNKRLN